MAIAVFYGGKSCEHDVSVITGLQVLNLLKSKEVIPVYIDRSGKWLVPKNAYTVSQYRNEVSGKSAFLRSGDKTLYLGKGKAKAVIDSAVICCHGAYGEDGCLQGILQSSGVAYTCSGVSASATGLNKILSKQAFYTAGLNLLPYSVVTRFDYENNLRKIVTKLAKKGYPLIVKPSSTGSSIGVSVARDGKSLITALNTAFEWDNEVIVEKALVDFTEYNCAVVGSNGKCRPSEIEKPAKVDEILSYKDKYERGGLSGKGSREFPAVISNELRVQIQNSAIVAFNAIGASGIARVDFLFDNETKQLFVNEINTVPGSLALYLFDDQKAVLEEIIRLATDERNRREKLTYRYESGVIRGKGD